MLAIITGITGQDGSYLADCLLSQNIKVVGIKRRTSTDNTWRIKHLINNDGWNTEYEFEQDWEAVLI